MRAVVSLPTLDELRDHVKRTLCSQDHLDPAQTPLQEGLITRCGRPCGVLFQARGPGLMQTHAIWAADENRLLFYNSSGARFAEARLTEAPDLPTSLI
jgi:hypothetical protein